jgi:integrase
MARARVTKAFVERVKAPDAGEDLYRDTEIRGFGLRVNWGGTRAFLLEARIKGRPRRITIGRYPDWSVLKARKQALKWRAEIAAGGDPTVAIERERGEPTFGNLAQRYIDDHAKPNKRSWLRDERRIEAHFGRWKGRRLRDVTATDVLKVKGEIAERHGKVAANRAMSLLRSMFNLASDWGLYEGANPAKRVKLYHEEPRERFLSPVELKQINEALAAEAESCWRAYFPLALMLGPRKSELLAARWADLDFEARTWRLPMTKAGRSHLLPLPEPAITILRALPSLGKSEWVFPSAASKTGHLVEAKAAWQRIRNRAGVPDVTIHDLRRTFGSWLAAEGYGLPLIGRALNHARSSSTEIYAKLQLDPVRAMLEQNATAMFGARPN